MKRNDKSFSSIYFAFHFLPSFTQVFGFQLDEEDMVALGNLHDGRHISWDPTNVD